ncbi:hypothetical protein LJC10_00515 [Selenomonadales bacterium OttesenSCG-928-I06]|nr:hypothetical protein [Selenomonadales bacterium OttesenSCG-928-I06]
MATDKKETAGIIEAEDKNSVVLKKSLDTKEGKIEKITFDFEKITGRDLLNIEKTARSMGDNTPSITFSMTYQALIAARATGLKYDDILDLKGFDFTSVLGMVNGFLFTGDL